MIMSQKPQTEKSEAPYLLSMQVKISDSAYPVSLLLRCRIDRNLFLVSTLSFKSYYTVNKCKQSVVSAASYVHARMDLCSTLSVKDVSSLNKLSVCSFCAQSL